MSLFADAFKQLTSLQKDSKTWETGPTTLVVATSLIDDTPKTIDFSTTVGHGKHAPKVGKRDDTNCFFLPKKSVYPRVTPTGLITTNVVVSVRHT